MTTTLYCARCGDRFEPDDDHVRVESEHQKMNDRNDQDMHVMHPRCWRELVEDWTDPV